MSVLISKELIKWYKQNARNLPWRETRDPYKIWLSEIILQQTRVAQGLPYYEKFVKAFPTVQDLAKAREQKVLKLWQGLGYYSRARNLHHAAKEVVKNYNSKFPNEFDELKKLKGIGDYTAAAIASFCFNKPHAVVDGNVYRVLARLFAIDTPINSGEGKKIFTQLANELIDKKDPGTFNQAIMEFGATVCAPANPQCDVCVLKRKCASGPLGKAGNYPVKIAAAKSKTRYFEYFFLANENKTFIEKRIGNDIWKSLYQLPLIEFKQKPSRQTAIEKFQKEILRSAPKDFEIRKISAHKKHLLSHQTILARFWQISVKDTRQLKGYRQIELKNLKKYPFPVLIGNHLREITIFE